MIETLRRARRKVSEVGLAYTLQLIFGRFIPLRQFVLLELSTQTGSRVDDPSPEVAWVGSDQEALLEEFGHAPSELRARFERGDRPCILVADGRLASYAWFRRVEFVEPDLATRFRLGPAEVWLYDAMVAQHLRGRGIYPQFLSAAAELLARECCPRILVQVERRNANALTAHLRAGAVPIMSLSALWLFGFVRVWDNRTQNSRWLRRGELNEIDVAGLRA